MVKTLLSFFALGIFIPSWVSSYLARFQKYPNASLVGFPLQGEESNCQSFVGCVIKCLNAPPCAAIILNVELKKCQLRNVVPPGPSGGGGAPVLEDLWIGGLELSMDKMSILDINVTF